MLDLGHIILVYISNICFIFTSKKKYLISNYAFFLLFFVSFVFHEKRIIQIVALVICIVKKNCNYFKYIFMLADFWVLKNLFCNLYAFYNLAMFQKNRISKSIILIGYINTFWKALLSIGYSSISAIRA